MAVKNFEIIVHYPHTKVGEANLERKVAELHADLVIKRINALNIPIQEKRMVVDKVIELIQNENEE